MVVAAAAACAAALVLRRRTRGATRCRGRQVGRVNVAAEVRVFVAAAEEVGALEFVDEARRGLAA